MIALLALLSLLGCSDCPGDYECPALQPIPATTLQIGEVNRVDVIDGTVTLGDDETVTLDYVDERGRTIRVRYRRTE